MEFRAYVRGWELAVPGDLVVELLPARHGDAILLGWGDDERHWMLVDGGPASAYGPLTARLTEVAREGHLELLVMTHIDGDHIEGVLRLCGDAGLALDIRDIWFNGSGQLTDELGPLQGEMLSALVAERGVPLNSPFEGRAVAARPDAPLPVHELPGGLRLTVLGPDLPTLARLRDNWWAACEEANLKFGSTKEALALLKSRKNLNPAESYLGESDLPDVQTLASTLGAKDYSLTNKSSIVLLAEYAEARVLLAGDATPGALRPALRRLLAERQLERLPLSAFKLPHHGSAANVTADVLALAPAGHYLFSSDGTSRSRHPDEAAVARVLAGARDSVDLVFNYKTAQNQIWADERIAASGYRFTTRYPAEGSEGVALTLSGQTGKAA
jgi:hypothetical protein